MNEYIYRLNQFCAANNLVFVETGSKNGTPGLWFQDFDGKRVFISKTNAHKHITQKITIPEL